VTSWPPFSPSGKGGASFLSGGANGNDAGDDFCLSLRPVDMSFLLPLLGWNDGGLPPVV